jgi:hypothetical protein
MCFVCVCVCVCVCACAFVHICALVCIFMCLGLNVCMCVYSHLCVLSVVVTTQKNNARTFYNARCYIALSWCCDAVYAVGRAEDRQPCPEHHQGRHTRTLSLSLFLILSLARSLSLFLLFLSLSISLSLSHHTTPPQDKCHLVVDTHVHRLSSILGTHALLNSWMKTYRHTHAHTQTQMRTHANMETCANTLSLSHTHTHTNTHIHTYTHHLPWDTCIGLTDSATATSGEKTRVSLVTWLPPADFEVVCVCMCALYILFCLYSSMLVCCFGWVALVCVIWIVSSRLFWLMQVWTIGFHTRDRGSRSDHLLT